MECHPTPSGGGFGWLRKFGHWVAHTAVPWVTRNRTALGWGEVALGIVSMIPGIGAAADVAFFIGMGLSAATTADECATRNGQGCAFGVTSMVFGGMGVGLNRVSDNLARAAERAKFFKSVALEVAADMTKVGSYATNGFSVASSVVSDLP
jgi:hypothetical protein